MSGAGGNCPLDWFEYLEGEVGEERRAEMMDHLWSCEACRKELERCRRLIGQLKKRDERLEGIDLTARLNRKASEVEQKGRLRGRLVLSLSAAAAVVIIAAGMLWFRQGGEYRTKGAVENPDKWVGISAWVIENGTSVGLGKTYRPSAALAFSYTNIGPEPFGYLMIFGVDSAGRIHWFHPAYLREGTNPESIGIEAGASERELPEKIRFNPAPGRLRIVALFTNRPLRVLQVEKMMKNWLEEGTFWKVARLPVPESGQHIIDVEVVP
ncbi:MAG: hypothetical protein D6806_14115 [Deltaproteobacteria bacterium]|nr:MAG: hypothetical protein D6806_14115 [Deltaproteobacteria bacterium]